MIRVADYIVQRLYDYGIRHAFMIVGGGAMYLNDAFGKSQIQYICNHHEQASAIAAEGYTRASGQLCVTIVTSGPGGTNTLTGVTGQWLDSIPALYISGQVKVETSLYSLPQSKLRQLGDQELNICDLVRPITKYTKAVLDPYDIGASLDKALYYATSGRPGPVWLDIPLDIQGALIDPLKMSSWRPQKIKTFSPQEKDPLVNQAKKLLSESSRPLIVTGHGIRLSRAQKELEQFIDIYQIPFVTTFNGFDLLPSDHPLFVGRIGTLGTRPGNFALQNADVVLFLGTRNNIRQVSYAWKNYARSAKKIVVDIDPHELEKKTITPDLPICMDVKEFLKELTSTRLSFKTPKHWITWCQEKKQKFPVMQEEYFSSKKVHPYVFIDYLTRHWKSNDVLVAGNGTACVALFQAGHIHKGQRIFWNSGCATMGYDLPAAIGAAVATQKDVICLAGDGSIMMNLQELATISHHKLPIKIFVLNNDGYQSIKQTQHNFFEGEFVGCSSSSGVSFPCFQNLSKSFQLPYFQISSHGQMKERLDSLLSTPGPFLCEVFLDENYIFAPKVASKKLPDGTMSSPSLEDMYPFLDKETLSQNMITTSLEEKDK